MSGSPKEYSTTFVLCSCFNEAPALARMWASVQTHIPGEVVLVVVDGRYADFDAQEDFSSDGTREFAQAVGHYVPVVDYECEKRSAGLRYIDTLAKEGDWVLNLDADETITGMFGWPERVGRFTFTRKTNLPVDYDRCRLYRWEPGLEFKHRHYDLYDLDGELVASLADAPSFDVIGTGDHFEKKRTPEKQDYFTRLRQRETPPSVAAGVGR